MKFPSKIIALAACLFVSISMVDAGASTSPAKMTMTTDIPAGIATPDKVETSIGASMAN